MADLLTMTDREQQVAIWRCERKNSLRKTGQILGITPERVRQIEAKALRKMRSGRYSPPKLG